MIFYQDPHRRSFKNLRVSLTDACNLNCNYCTLGTDEEENVDHRPQQTAEKFIQLIALLHKNLHLESVRLTGGEPLLYRELPELILGIKSLGIKEINLTTNGFLLARKAEQLGKAGLNTINVSLDAIDESVFTHITKRKNDGRIFTGIENALQQGINVKLNAVVMKGINEHQILPLLNYAFSKNITIRFLELMTMGHLFETENSLFYAQQQILNTISQEYNFKPLIRKKSATANYWQTINGQIFGIIANESAPFCTDCNRLRLDAHGNIYGCLSNNQPISIINCTSNKQIEVKLNQALQQKQLFKFTGSELSMLKIGG